MRHQLRRDPPLGHAGRLPARGEITRGGARGPRHEPSLSYHPRARDTVTNRNRGGGSERGGIEVGGRVGRGREAAAAGNGRGRREGDPEMRMWRGVRGRLG